MKILLTNNHLNTFGGSENWTFTVYSTLKKMGHSVDVFAIDVGGVGTQRFGSVYTTIPDVTYDLVIANHNTCVEVVLQKAKYSKLIMMCHGVIPHLEQPIKGADRYISISNEIQYHLLLLGYRSDVILNPVDLDVYHPTKELNETPQKIFALCQNINAQQNIKSLGFDTECIPPTRGERLGISNETFNEADICVGLGRSAYESLACGRCVIVYDARGYNGDKYDSIVTRENIGELLRNNLSGRRFNKAFNADKILRGIKTLYRPNTEYYRSIAEDYFDAKKIVNQILQ